MNNSTLSLAIFLMIASETAAFGAAVPIPRDTVENRARPELEPLGVRVGAFMMYAQIGARLYHNDNIYAESSNEVADRVLVTSPWLKIRSGWSRHSLTLSGMTDIGRYTDNPSENFEDVRVAVDGRLDITHNDRLRLSVRLESLHEDRFSPDARGGASPTLFDREIIGTGYERTAGKLTLKLDGRVTNIDFEDVAGSASRINNDDRDRRLSDLAFEVAYVLDSAAELFVRGASTSVDYESAFDDNGIARSSSGLEIAAGARMDLSTVTSLEGFAGVIQRNYDDAQLEDISAAWYGGNLIWRISGLTTASASVSRRIEETIIAGASGNLATRVGTAIDHELLRNLVLHLSVYQQENDYISIDRNDDVFGIRFNANYMMNRHLGIVFSYDVRDRDINSAVPGDDGIDTTTISLQIIGKQ